MLCVTISSGLSATYQSARTAAEAVSDRIAVRVVDTQSVTMGQGLLVLAAADMASDGVGLDDMATVLEDMKGRTHVYGVVDSLDYLKRGGRIGGRRPSRGVAAVDQTRDRGARRRGRGRVQAAHAVRARCSTWPTRRSRRAPSSASAPPTGWPRTSTRSSRCCAGPGPSTSS